MSFIKERMEGLDGDISKEICILIDGKKKCYELKDLSDEQLSYLIAMEGEEIDEKKFNKLK